MVKLLYEIEKTNNGYRLIGSGSVFIMNKSNRNNGSDFYIKQIKPTENYLTGLFFKKKYNAYYGKTIDNKKIIVKLGFNLAEILFF